MRKKFSSLAVALVAVVSCLSFSSHLALGAQEEPATEEAGAPSSDRMFTVVKRTEYADAEDLLPILRVLPLQIRIKPDLNAIVLRGETERDIDMAIRLIESLDVPPEPGRNVELTVFVLAASKQERRTQGLTEGLVATVKQLGDLFGYRAFELVDTVFLRVRDGRQGSVEGGIDLGQGILARYHLHFNQVSILPRQDQGRVVRLDGLSFQLNSDQAGEVQRVHLRTDVEVREGQKAVVGKSTPQGAAETLILVVEARVLQGEGLSPGVGRQR